MSPPGTRLLYLLVMTFGRAAGLNVVRVDGNTDGLSIPRGVAPAMYDRVKAVFPEAVVFFVLPRNESQPLAFADDSLASWVAFGGGVTLSGLGGLSLRDGAGGGVGVSRAGLGFWRLR